MAFLFMNSLNNVVTVVNAVGRTIQFLREWRHGRAHSASDVVRLVADLAVDTIGVRSAYRMVSERAIKPLYDSLFTSVCVIRNVVVENEYNFENSMVLFILAGHEIGVLQRFFDPESVKAAVDQMQEIYNGKRTLFCGGRKVVAWTAKATSWWIRHRQEIPAELRPRVDNFLDQETDNTGIPEEIRARFRDNIPEEYWGDRFWRRHADLRCHLTDRPIRRIARIVGEEGRYYEYETLKTFLLEHNRPESDIDVISDDVIRRQGYITHKVFEYMDRVMDTHIFNSAYED